MSPTLLVGQLRRLERVRDQRHREHVAGDSVDREADAVDGDRALRGEKARHLRRRRDVQLERRARRPPRHDRAHDVDVARAPCGRPADRPTLSGRSRWTRLPGSSAPSVVSASVSGPRSAAKCPAARSTMVRQTPSTAMLAPIGIASTGEVGDDDQAHDRPLIQLNALDRLDDAERFDDSREHDATVNPPKSAAILASPTALRLLDIPGDQQIVTDGAHRRAARAAARVPAGSPAPVAIGTPPPERRGAKNSATRSTSPAAMNAP